MRDSCTELNDLVEDKEVAARAVAFVVNSTRKGIVPLCADIANLLRAKRSLEKKVYLLRREVEALRSSTSVSIRTSNSTSPTLPLTDKPQVADVTCLQERSRPCSRCSQCSSTVSNSPKLESTYSFKSYLPSPSVSRDALRRTSPRLARQIPRPPVNGTLQHCSAQTSPEMNTPRSAYTSRQGLEHATSAGRKNSLPEITGQPDVEVQKVSPKISKETQCRLLLPGNTPLEDQFIETLRINAKLAEDLGSARKENEVLKCRLKELEMNQLAKECAQEHYRQDSNHTESASTVSRVDSSHKSSNVLNVLFCYIRPRVPSPQGSHFYAEPLYGCKCTACEEAMGGEIHAALSTSLNEDLQKFPVNSKVMVQLGDHVVVKGDKTGRIRYIGHLDKIGKPNLLFVGLELDAPVGNHDGFFNNKRYYFCQKDHGLFVALHDIICKVCSKTTNGPGDGTEDSISTMANEFLSSVMMTSKKTDDFIALVGLTSKSSNNRASYTQEQCSLDHKVILTRDSDALKSEQISCAEDLV
ncbi:unnamed protein product [Candidula unifasciata]|uniref:CAP-Gly domain-containing protein n=1 Tax=Candidula unifasciata TaxID=100452 RepID=A0A8S3ZKQ7_9EUPU|nr:unnamed protein product [Candidula unifasciata]